MARCIAFVLTVAIGMDCPHRAVAVELADCAVHCDVELARLRAELAQARGDCTIMQRRIDALELELRHSESDRLDRSAAAGALLAFAPFCTRRRASKKRVLFRAGSRWRLAVPPGMPPLGVHWHAPAASHSGGRQMLGWTGSGTAAFAQLAFCVRPTLLCRPVQVFERRHMRRSEFVLPHRRLQRLRDRARDDTRS